MKIYLVGGAVRDQLLGLPVQERDWVVVGSTPEALLSKGFQQVGKDFPVFLHPRSKEEYALARRERKIAPGYTGFSCDVGPEVSLIEDLARRDLTINAMAQSSSGVLIDPYHGLSDLQNKILRHVSPAFTEDPVRVLRVARFAARYAHLGFTIAPQTMSLMQDMVSSGELQHLVPERVWKEWSRALLELSPAVFFTVLAACHADLVLWPELVFNPYVSNALAASASLHSSLGARFAILMSQTKLSDISTIAQRYVLPKICVKVAKLIAAYHEKLLDFTKLSAECLFAILVAIDVWRNDQLLPLVTEACLALAAAQQRNFADDKLLEAVKVVTTIRARDIPENITGPMLGAALTAARTSALARWLASAV